MKYKDAPRCQHHGPSARRGARASTRRAVAAVGAVAAVAAIAVGAVAADAALGRAAAAHVFPVLDHLEFLLVPGGVERHAVLQDAHDVCPQLLQPPSTATPMAAAQTMPCGTWSPKLQPHRSRSRAAAAAAAVAAAAAAAAPAPAAAAACDGAEQRGLWNLNGLVVLVPQALLDQLKPDRAGHLIGVAFVQRWVVAEMSLMVALDPRDFVRKPDQSCKYPELKVSTPAHTKYLGWYLEFEFRVTHKPHHDVSGYHRAGNDVWQGRGCGGGCGR